MRTLKLLAVMLPLTLISSCSANEAPSLLATTIESARDSGALTAPDAVPGSSLSPGVTVIQTVARPYPEIGPVTLIEITEDTQTACLAQSEGATKQIGVAFEACPNPIDLATDNGATVSRAIAETAVLRYQLRSGEISTPVDDDVMAGIVAELVEEGYDVTATPIAQGKAVEFRLDGTVTCFVSGTDSFRYQDGFCPASGT